MVKQFGKCIRKANMSRPKQYDILGNFCVTKNPKERTFSIYTRDWVFLSTVNEGELYSEIEELEKVYD